MQLNMFTDICLKSIMYIKQAERIVTINEISKQFSVPRNHLVKALNLLVKLKWLHSIRGRNGGLIYNIKSDNLKLGEVIQILEVKKELFDCNNCILNANCLLRKIINESLYNFYFNLNKYTLGDLNKGEIGRFINIMQLTKIN